MTAITTCAGCNTVLTPEDPWRDGVDGKPYCEPCYMDDLSSGGIVSFAGPGIDREGNDARVVVGRLFREGQYGEDPTIATFTHGWVSTDGWRGYAETKIDGWTEIMSGWTTQGWDDAIARRKGVFNDWAQNLLDGRMDPPKPIAVVVDTTSNAFSMAVGVWVADDDVDDVKAWLRDDLDILRDCLS